MPAHRPWVSSTASLRGPVAGWEIVDHVSTTTRYRLSCAVLTVLFAYVLVRAATADDPSTVSVVIRAVGLAVCSWSLVASLTRGRERRDPVRGDADAGWSSLGNGRDGR